MPSPIHEQITARHRLRPPAGEVAHSLIGATALVGLADTQVIHPRCGAAATVS
jgi:hypothetical protein